MTGKHKISDRIECPNKDCDNRPFLGDPFCSKCGTSIMTPKKVKKSIKNVQYGWICPVCGSGVSPLIDKCPCEEEAHSSTGAIF